MDLCINRERICNPPPKIRFYRLSSIENTISGAAFCFYRAEIESLGCRYALMNKPNLDLDGRHRHLQAGPLETVADFCRPVTRSD